MSQGFKMGAAFVEVTTEDKTKDGRQTIGSGMTKWAGGLDLGKIISDDLAKGVASPEAIAELRQLGTQMTQWANQLDLGEPISEDLGKGLDNSDIKPKLNSLGSQMTQWAGGLALGVTISKGITDNLDIGASNAKLSAQLNLTKEVAGKMGALSGQIYRDNFGESIPAVNSAIASVGQNLYNLNTASKESIKGITEDALGLASTFDQDVNEVVRAAGSLLKNNLAPNAETAMNILTRTFQMGGNVAGDLLDTITEYSPQFAKLGFDGETAMGVIVAGFKAGARDGDVIADIFKELSLRAIDMSTLTASGYEMIGVSAQGMAQRIAAGGKTAQDAMLEIIRRLQDMKDPIQQNAAGTALFGTQWEDTLRAIIPKMDITESALTDVAGATDKMNAAAADSAANGIESVKRATEGWVQSMTNAEGPLGAVSSWALGTGEWAIPLLGNLAMIGAGFVQMGLFAEGSALRVVGSWIAMAASSVANAIVMAASWLLAFWPVALIIAAVAALAYLIITNWDTIRQWTVDTWNAIWKFVSDIITAIVTAFQTALQAITDAWNAAWKFVSDIITAIVNAFKAAVDGIVAAWDWLSALPGKFWNWLVSIMQGAGTKLGELIDWFKSLPGKLLSALGDLGRLLWDAGRKILQGLWDGLKSMWNKVKDWVGDIGGWISDLKGPIEVDAVILIPHGNAFMKGLQKGLKAGFETEVKPTVAGMSHELARMPTPLPTFTTDGIPGGIGVTRGANGTVSNVQPVHIENLTVTFPGSLNAMSKTNLRAAASFLNEELRNLNRSRVGQGAS